MAYTPRLGTSFTPTFPAQFSGHYDIVSLATTPIQYIDLHGELISSQHATGFFYRWGPEVFLVSARHAISGLRAFDDSVISPNGYLPQAIRVFPFQSAPFDRRLEPHLELRVRDPEGTALWREDPLFQGLRTDIAAVRIDHQNASNFICANDLTMEESLMSHVGFDCFILGYPNGNFHSPYLPVWRRGALAYEPLSPVDDKPLFLVDASTSEGLSGGPILQRWHGPAPVRQADGTMNVLIENIVTTRLIGVYGGRLDSAREMGQVGYGWYANRIPEILRSSPATPPTYSGGTTLTRGGAFGG